MLGGSGLANGWSAGRSDKTTPEIPLHYPYVRVLQLDWEELPTGFRARRSDETRFEIICAACGDIDGPAEYQPVAVRGVEAGQVTIRPKRFVAALHQLH